MIEDIEKLRKRENLTVTEMAARFGVIYQNYNNWIARGSLPKKYYPAAQEMLAMNIDYKDLDDKAMQIYDRLSEKGKKAAIATLQAIESLEAESE